MGKQVEEFNNLVTALDVAHNHFNNALGDCEVTQAIYELIVAEVSYDNFIYSQKHKLKLA